MAENNTNSTNLRHRQKAGVIKRIRLENFMCHSNLEIELGEWVNFITGQNGSGKSAILTALCVAFGCRARGTQRATTLKDFIKTGCCSAIVHVEIQNEGEDAFKPEIYGDHIIVERRISESTSSTVLKDCQGKKVVSRKSELLELVEHFNIDVENPCVIMSQDKSREFLHSGSEKEKFKFYFKATLLQQVSDLLEGISKSLGEANAVVGELESEIRPLENELNELQNKIKNMEHVEQIAQQVQQLRKKLAWSWVYHIDNQLQEQRAKVDKLKDRIPTCQARIDHQTSLLEGLKERVTKKKVQITCMMEKTAEVRRLKDDLQKKISLATKEKRELEEECSRGACDIENLVKRVRLLEQQVRDIHEKHAQNTQANEFEREKILKQLENEVDGLQLDLRRLKEEENTLLESLQQLRNEVRNLLNEIEIYGKRQYEIDNSIHKLQGLQTNKVSAFGGDRVHNLLQRIERRCDMFQIPPIGPIGAHLRLKDGDTWAYAVENAIGKFFNAFIVTCHKDSLLLRQCAREANCEHLQIVIYDFSRKRLVIPNHLLPNTSHPTTLSVVHSDNDTVINVLVDMGSAERQVLVKDYDSGKKVAFDPQILNVKEVHTMDGYKMFSRGSVQTILPPNKRQRTARLRSSYDDQIQALEEEASLIPEAVSKCHNLKRNAEKNIAEIEGNLHRVKRLCRDAERKLSSKNLEVLDTQKIDEPSSASTVDELHQEISKLQQYIQEKEILQEKVQVRMHKAAAIANDLKLSFKELCDSAQGEVDAFEKADRELMHIEQEIQSAEAEKAHYEGVMNNKVIHDIKVAEGQYQDLQHIREENSKKASIICPESDLESIGGWDGSSPDQLSAQLNRLTQRLQQESNRYSDSIDDLRMLYAEKERKISRKQQTYKAFHEKLDACQKALELRWGKFHRNASLLKRQLTWQFNGHLGKKGISGQIKINYEEKTLSVEVKMPQDASNSTVRDTRGLSGGERSFSTLCFALALHEMTEAPFRAMDEFDVFMDAVSRKISLDTLVDFAEAQGSQWIFITPHDISMVRQGDRIKKQQMAAPRS